jgi:membrane complex biogenesis BtpA family protein
MSEAALPPLIGVIHAPPLPGSPRYAGDMAAILAAVARDAAVLARAGFDAVLLENFGDAPFARGPVGPETVAAMAVCARAVRAAAPALALGVNVLRNDAVSALAIAASTEATLVRVSVHVGARLTDQGLVQGEAFATLRYRRQLGLADRVRLFCDVNVKHSLPLASQPLAAEARELTERGLADAVLVTGTATGAAPDPTALAEVAAAVPIPVYLASGATAATLALFPGAHGVVVGSTLRADGRAGGPVDAGRAEEMARAFRARSDRA